MNLCRQIQILNFEGFQYSSAVITNWNSDHMVYARLLMDNFVKESTRFNSWEEMVMAASDARLEGDSNPWQAHQNIWCAARDLFIGELLRNICLFGIFNIILFNFFEMVEALIPSFCPASRREWEFLSVRSRRSFSKAATAEGKAGAFIWEGLLWPGDI